jgi:hypothetical protein
MALALRGEEAAGPIERHVVPDRSQDVVELLVLMPRIAHAVRRDERQLQRAGEIDERAVSVLLLPQVVALELDVEPARKDPAEAREEILRGVEASLPERARDRALVASGQDVQSLGVRGDLVERDGGLPLRLPERARGDQPAEVPVAGTGLDEEGKTRENGGGAPASPSPSPPVAGGEG